MTLEIRPLTPALGAEILGADPDRDDHFEAIHAAFVEHAVVAIRDLRLAPDDLLAFARRWGEINVNRFFTPLDGHPEIATITKEPEHDTAIGTDWHTDHSYDAIPAMGSLLYAVETPEIGGDTAFASMHAAYMALSEGFRHTLDGLRAWHSSRHVFGTPEPEDSDRHTRVGNAEAATQDALHPLVITHPLSGRRGIYVNRTFTTHIDGWTPEESAPLLSQLYAHCARPEFTCRLRWQPGTLGIWDNRATWHKAINDYPGQRRVMHRVTIEGVALG